MSERFTPELPERLVTAKKLATLRRALLADAADELKLNREQTAWVETGAANFGMNGALHADNTGGSPKIPAGLAGSDEVSIMYTWSTDKPDEDGTVVGLKLFQDGSPYVIETDEDALDDLEGWYTVIAAEDGPPVLIHTAYFDKYAGGGLGVGDVKDLSKLLSQEPTAVHYLDDAECSALISAVEQAAPSLDKESIMNNLEEYFAPTQ
jgi:hypothetical protein